MADSIRKRILSEVKQRLSVITPDNPGFVTDAGQHIFIGVLPKLGPDDPDAAIAILPHDHATGYQLQHVVGEWPIEIIAVANASENRQEPWLLVEDVLADLQRAMETEDRTFAGTISRHDCFEVGAAKTFERESASDVVAISQLYVFSVKRVWGHPDVK
jgi:hypothetical protein